MNETHVNTVGNAQGELLKDIYVIKNKVNDYWYIGQAKNTEERFKKHCKNCSNDSVIDKAIKLFGKENFWYEILESQIPNYNERERYWIQFFNTKVPNGYNVQDGGEAPPVFYGINHPLSGFNNMNEVEALKNDLRNTTMSLSEIADKYHQSKRTVLRINQGLHYEKIGEEYPIRKRPNMNGKLTDEDVDEIIEILKYSYRQYSDISKQYGVGIRAIQTINTGESHRRENESYPIRKYKNSGIPALTYEQVTEITDLLSSTNISCNELSRMYNVNLNEIYLVNNGKSKRYHRDQYTYPLRKHHSKE